MNKDELEWGTTVKITAGRHKGRIGCYDNEEKGAIVYFGDIWFAGGFHIIPFRYLSIATTSDLMTRRGTITASLCGSKKDAIPGDERVALMVELMYIYEELAERAVQARLFAGSGKKVFISHSSKDKQFARWLATDLKKRGHEPWLDEWKIRVGQSIPMMVSEGIESCDVMAVVLSENALTSKWVENEWQAKYWDEIREGHIKVLPLLLEKCQIPTLLKAKKYADFSHEYNEGLEDLLTFPPFYVPRAK